MKQYALIKIDNPRNLQSLSLVGIFDEVEEAEDFLFGSSHSIAMDKARELFTGSFSINLGGVFYVLLEED